MDPPEKSPKPEPEQQPSKAKEMTEEKDTQWTDDRIRWHGEFKDNEGEEEEEEEECAYMDPFKDQNPFETFSFEFAVPDRDNPIQIDLRGYKTGADEVWKSTGLTIWRAAEYLGKYMASHPKAIEGHKVLELGAGLGLCGILAHRLGGSTVCITDGDSDALVHLRENLDDNKSSDAGEVSGHQLIWGEETSRAFAERHGTFEVLLASDIIYAKCIVEPLWETVQTLLSPSPASVFIMAYYARRNVNITIEVVLEHAQGAGFTYELVDEDPEGVRVFVFRRKQEEG